MRAMAYISAAATCLHISLHQTTIYAQKDFQILECWTACVGGFTGNEVIPGTGCVYYHECWDGQVRAQKECGPPLVFNEERDYCDFPANVYCPEGEAVCPGQTLRPTEGPSVSPSEFPSGSPTASPSSNPTSTPSSSPSNKYYGDIAISYIESKRDLIENYVFISYNPSGLAYPSKSYKYEDFIQSLQVMAVKGFGADFKFHLWEGNPEKYYYGLVNLAAFLANAMVESIEADTCDELNWQQVSGRHAISNSCGQENRSYQDETCDLDADIYSCNVLPQMDLMAVSMSSSTNAPPMRCEPGSGQEFYSGYWDSGSNALFSGAPYTNDLGRTDTEGCCWWGRGALLTRNVCNLGKVNYYLGMAGAKQTKATLYPTVNFCAYPETICGSTYSELRWTVALFEWAERVQRYTESYKWSYEEKLIEFVDNGMSDDSFIESVSRILSRNCHTPGCSDYEVRHLDKRRSNFYLILNDILDIKTILNPPNPTQQPTTPRPTQLPTRVPTKQQIPAGLSPPSLVATHVSKTPYPSKDLHVMSPHDGLPSPTSTLTENQNPNSNPVEPTVLARDDESNQSSDTILIGIEDNGAEISPSPTQVVLILLIIMSATW